MKENYYLSSKSNRGITLLALAITVIVLLIIASITVYEGSNVLKESLLQKNITNMLAIKSKIKGYSEEIDSKTWNEGDSDKENKKSELFNNYNIVKTTVEENYVVFKNTDYDNGTGKTQYEYVYYYITNATLDSMKLSNLKDSDDNRYLVVFAKDDNGDYISNDIIYIGDITYEGNSVYHTLSELQDLIPDE